MYVLADHFLKPEIRMLKVVSFRNSRDLDIRASVVRRIFGLTAFECLRHPRRWAGTEGPRGDERIGLGIDVEKRCGRHWKLPFNVPRIILCMPGDKVINLTL